MLRAPLPSGRSGSREPRPCYAKAAHGLGHPASIPGAGGASGENKRFRASPILTVASGSVSVCVDRFRDVSIRRRPSTLTSSGTYSARSSIRTGAVSLGNSWIAPPIATASWR
jgi:hypothetical protein